MVMTRPPDQDHAELDDDRDSPALPLASSLAKLAPSHPLLHLVVLNPALEKLAHVEHAILTSAPAQTLLRYRLASERALVALVGLASLGAVVRWRRQWRAMVYTLAIGDVVKRTVDLLVKLGEPDTATRKRPRSEPARGRDNDSETRQETQHVLSFWLLVALLSLAESFRTTPRHSLVVSPTLSISARLGASLRRVRHTYLQFLRRYILPTLLRTRWAAQRFVSTYPSFDPAPILAKLPTVPGHYYLRLPFTAIPRARPRPAASFPQPSAHASDRPPRGTGPMPLAWSWFLASSGAGTTPASASTTAAAEIRWTVLKLVVLLMGQRTDSLGARNVLWKWGVEPLVAATSRLRGLSNPSFAEDGDEQEKWVVKVVRESRRRSTPRGAPAVNPVELPIRIVDSSRQVQDADETGDQSRQIDELSGVSPYAWTPRSARVVRPASVPGSSPAPFDPPRSHSPSSTSATPRRPLSRSYDQHQQRSVSPSSGRSSSTASSAQSQSRSYSTANRSASASPSPYQLQSPPFLPTPARNANGNHATASSNGGTSRSTPAGVTYRFASAHHPLLGPRSSSSASSNGSATVTTTALTHAALNGLRLRSGDPAYDRREASFTEEEEEEDEDDDDDDGLLTPGEEEAEEGQRKWAGIVA